jgi:S1-C subfamily serine protease
VVRPEIGISKVYEIDGGLMIAELVPGGPAERAGLRGPKIVVQRRQRGDFVFERQTVDRSSADVIVAVEGTRISSADEFLSEIEAKQPGDEVTVTVIRDGRETPIRVRLRESEE